MKNDNLVKPPTTPYGERTMKIEYAGHKQSTGEGFTLFFFFGFLVFPSVGPWITLLVFNGGVSLEDGVTVGKIVAGYIPHFFIALGFLALYLFFRSKRHKRLAKIKETIEKGQLVIGSIQSIEAVSTGSDGDHTEYFYRIKYKKPDSEEEIEFRTPYLAAHPQIRNNELPLKTKVYIYEDQAYADEIIDPPVEKVSTRRLIRGLLAGLCMLFCLSGIFLMGPFMTLGVILFVIGCVLMMIVNYVDRL